MTMCGGIRHVFVDNFCICGYHQESAHSQETGVSRIRFLFLNISSANDDV